MGSLLPYRKKGGGLQGRIVLPLPPIALSFHSGPSSSSQYCRPAWETVFFFFYDNLYTVTLMAMCALDQIQEMVGK